MIHNNFYCGICLFDFQDIIATGGVDTNAVVFDRTSGEILSTLSGHSKKVFLFSFPFFIVFIISIKNFG